MTALTLVYYVIALATATHTAWGAAVTMQGAMPADGGAALLWWAQGALYAVGIDVSMLAVASRLHKATQRRVWLGVTFAVTALASAYFQLVYAFAHSTPIADAGGISAAHAPLLQSLVDLRVWVAPLALPLIATLYALTGLVTHERKQENHAGVNAAVAVTVEPAPELTAPKPTLPAGKRVCSACGAETSNLSRHRKKCVAYQQMVEVQ